MMCCHPALKFNTYIEVNLNLNQKTMNYWLVKTEAGTYSWSNLEKDKKTTWDGVRNFQARSNLKAMAKGDLVLFYHTGDEKAVVGIARVVKEAYPDPKDKEWTVVDLAPERSLKRAVTLAEIKSTRALAAMVLVRNSRLSVQPVKKEEYEGILKLSQ